MLKPKKSCRVCQTLKTNRALVKEIYSSRFYMKTTGPSLMSIARKYQDSFSYESLKNHVSKHQFISAEDYNQRHLTQIAKNAEAAIIKKKFESMDVFDEIVSQGMEALQAGDLQVTMNHLIRASQLKKDFQLKEKDQELAYADMVMFYASGANKIGETNNYDRRFVQNQAGADQQPAERTGDDSRPGTDRPSDLYRGTAGDETPRGPEEVSEGDNRPPSQDQYLGAF